MTQRIKIEGNFGLDGKVKATLAKLETDEQWKLHKEIERRIRLGHPFMELVRRLNKICRVKIFEYCNITTTVGRTMIINNLCDTAPDNTMLINYGAVGTNNTAPAVGDSQLVAENTRKLIASRTNAAQVGYISQFYTATEAVAQLYETGLFSNATAVADSGILVIRALININKQNTETLTIDHTLTLSDI